MLDVAKLCSIIIWSKSLIFLNKGSTYRLLPTNLDKSGKACKIILCYNRSSPVLFSTNKYIYYLEETDKKLLPSPSPHPPQKKRRKKEIVNHNQQHQHKVMRVSSLYQWQAIV